jgi:hypothetical protein
MTTQKVLAKEEAEKVVTIRFCRFPSLPDSQFLSFHPLASDRVWCFGDADHGFSNADGFWIELTSINITGSDRTTEDPHDSDERPVCNLNSCP